MLTLTLACLILVASLATALSLIDSLMRARSVYAALKRERVLLDAGFVPQVHAHELRLRAPARQTFGSAARPYTRRMLRPEIQVAG